MHAPNRAYFLLLDIGFAIDLRLFMLFFTIYRIKQLTLFLPPSFCQKNSGSYKTQGRRVGKDDVSCYIFKRRVMKHVFVDYIFNRCVTKIEE